MRLEFDFMKPRYLLLLSSIFLLPFLASSQNQESFFKVPFSNTKDLPEWTQLMYSENPNVYEVSDLFIDHYRENEFIKTTHTQNYKFWLKSVEEYLDPDGLIVIPSSKEYKDKIEQHLEHKQLRSNNTTVWNSIGPFNTYKNDGSLNLRPTQTNVSSIAVAPSNPDILFCGANTGGGVFKSIDHGLNWVLVTLNDPIGNAIDIKIHPLDPNIVYMSDGSKIFKTVDGGSTWVLNYTAPGTVQQFYIHRTLPNVVYAATASGLFMTANDGASWTNIFNEKCWDIEAHVIDPDIIYLSINNPIEVRAEIYKSYDAGSTWALKDNNWYIPTDIANASDIGCKIGVTPADPDRVYAGLIGNSKAGDNGWIGIYYSLDSADTWVNADGIDGGPYVSGSDMNTNWFFAGYSSGYHQGWYNYDLDVSHVDPDRLWVGTIWACESANRGANIEYIRGTRNLEMHADIQDIDVVGNEIWYTSDGGINYSTDEMQTVEIRQTGISASTYWGFSQGWNEDTWTGGRYHNGDAVYHENFGSGNTMFLGGAETSTGYINPLNNRLTHFSDIGDKKVPDALFLSSTNIPNLSLYPNEAYTTLNSSEIEYHPNYADHMYLGKDNIFYGSVDGGISFDPLFTFNGSARVLEFEISRMNTDVIYCLVRDGGAGTIYRSNDGGNSFVSITTIPSNNISRLDLSLDPSDPDHLWVISHNGANGQKVYRSIDAGVTWTNKTTSELDGHKILDVLYQAGTDDLVYIVTDLAAFYWDSVVSDWIMYSDGLPFYTRALRMKPFYRDSKLRLSSSRGVWEAPFAQTSLPEAEPMTANDIVYCSRDTIQFEDYSFLDHNGSTWEWTFTPAPFYVSSSTARNPKVIFDQNGSYNVTLTITDGTGSSSTKTIPSMITLDDQCSPDPFPGGSLNCESSPDYANIPNLELSQVTDFTISAWVKPNGEQPAYTGIVMNDGDAAGLNFRAGNVLAYHWPGGAWWWDSGLIVDSGKWSHVAMVVQANSITLYLNGNASTHVTNPSPVDIGTMKMGSYKAWTSRNYNGELDEVSIWNTALTQNDIRKLRHLTRTGSTPFTQDLFAYYQFNLMGSSIISDKVGLKHASLNGGASKINSTAPISGGESHRISVSLNGSYNFGDTELEIDFNTNTPNGEIVATRLHSLPDSMPSSNPNAGNYWVINNYGAQNFSDLNGISFKPSIGVASGNPSDAKLYSRSENDDLNNWSELCSANDLDGGSYNYDLTCEIDNFSQFFIQSANANEIQGEFCVSSNFTSAPTGLFEDQNVSGGTKTRLNWDHYSNVTDGCIIKGGTIGSLDVNAPYTQTPGQVIIQGAPISDNGGLNYSAQLAPNASFTLFNPVTYPSGGTGGLIPGEFYKWQVQCGCIIDISLPLPDRLGLANVHLSPWSEFDLFTNLSLGSVFPEETIDLLGQAISLNIFPNPANESVVVQSEKGSITIYNSIGIKVFHGFVINEQIEVDIQKWSAGIYLVNHNNDRTLEVDQQTLIVY